VLVQKTSLRRGFFVGCLSGFFAHVPAIA